MIQQATLIGFHKWLGGYHSYLFGRRSCKKLRRLKRYEAYLSYLKQKEGNYYERLLWLEIHGEIN